MGASSIGVHFNVSWSQTSTCTLSGPLCDAVEREEVISIHAEGGYVVGQTTFCEGSSSRSKGHVRRDGPLVIDDIEDNGGFEGGCKIQSIVIVSLR